VRVAYEAEKRLVSRLFSWWTGYVEHRRYPGWRSYLPFYRRVCPRHGEYLAYPHGFKGYLPCPECLRENLE